MLRNSRKVVLKRIGLRFWRLEMALQCGTVIGQNTDCEVFMTSGSSRPERRDFLIKSVLSDKKDAFLASGKGKLYLKDGPFFNLSHSEEYSVLAVSKSNPVGVDIEKGRTIRFVREMASHFFHPDELSFLECTAWNPKVFLEMWVAKEALSKCFGGSIFELCRMINTCKQSVDIKKIELDRDVVFLGIYLSPSFEVYPF